MDWLAQGLEVLADEGRRDARALCFDVVIVGSGYGGAVMAARLARLRRADGTRLRIAVLERGREYVPGEFPNDLGMLPGAVRVDRGDRSRPIGNPDALFHVHVDRDVCVLTGSALGGTSQINANVAIEADDDVLRGPQWPRVFRDTPGLLDPHYAQARRTLGVVDYPGDVPKARAFAAVAPHIERRHLRDADPQRPSAGARLRPAPLAVRFAANGDAATDPSLVQPNPAGVPQRACIECGDCVSGCNHWAKNTLTMNYLPLARRRGVRLFTGATVQHLRPDPQSGWIVTVDATVAETRPVRSERIAGAPMQLRAARVVLCAGALGSTEILLRSRAVHGLSLSPRLGTGFSTNGDMISAAYWQRDPVGAVGLGADAGGELRAAAGTSEGSGAGPDPAPPRRRVGPTITSIVDLRDARVRERRILIEDGAVPGALGDVFGEVLASAALLPQRVRWKTQAQRHRDPDMDPEGFGVSDTATHHSQLLLSIGHDDARGVLALKTGRDDDGFRRARIDWRGGDGAPSAQAQPVYRHQADLLRGVEARGAIPLDNPLWRPVPEAITSVLGAGVLPQGVLLSVHPLGGCRMADDAADGVCTAQGEVFDGPQGTSVHAGLFVCDGSILPSSLGANPFLTIAALAERSAALLAAQMVGSEGLVPCDALDPLPTPPALRPAPPVRDRRVAVVFEERMRGRPEQLEDAAGLVPIFGERMAGLQRARTSDRGAAGSRDQAPFLALDVRLEIDDLRDYVRTLGRGRSAARRARPGAACGPSAAPRGPSAAADRAPRVSGQLRILQDRSDLLAGQDVDPVGDCSIELSNGRFDLLVERRMSAPRRLMASLLEFRRLWCRHRTGPRSPPPEAERPDADAPGVVGWLRRGVARLVVYANLLRHLGTERTIDYRFDLVGRDGRAYRLVGRKRLVFADAVNPWLSVADLHVEIRRRHPPADAPVWSGRLRLDPLEIVQHKVPQVTRAPHAPESIVQMASYGLLFARAILGTHLLHFRAPDYEPALPFDETPPGVSAEAAPRATADGAPGAPAGTAPEVRPQAPAVAPPRRRRWPGPLPGTCGPVHHRIRIDDDLRVPGLQIALTHYASPASGARRQATPVLIFHGILHSTLAFATDTVDENLTQALCRAGYDVWLVDFRTSIAFGDAPQPLSFDQIARHDVPAAVRFVLARSGAQQVNVFAHCMGAAVFSMSLLAGWVDPAKIRALVYCQVSFLVSNAYGNRLRAEVSAFVRDALAFERIDPRADASADALERLLDRLATTVPVPDAERDAHRAHDLYCATMPRDAATCNRLTLLIGRHWFHHNLDPRTHAALGELLGPSRIETFFQIQHFGLRGRVMTALGDNAYVTDENLRRAFGALPVLFIQGAESDVFDTRTTRLAHRKLRAVTGLDHRIHLYPGYGHLECVFGRDARTVVYPDVVRFLDAPPSNLPRRVGSSGGEGAESFPPEGGIPTVPDVAAAPNLPPPAQAPASDPRPVVRAPWIGPVLGAARPDPCDPDRLLVRVWFAPDTRVSDTPWGRVEYRGALSRFASPQARFAVTRWPPGPQGAPGMPRHVLQETAFRRPSVPAGAGAGAGRATADGGCCEDGVIVGTVGMSLGDAWADRDLGADHVHAQDAPAPDLRRDDAGAGPWTDPPEVFLARAVRLRAAQVTGLLQQRGQATHTRMLLASCRHPGNFFERDRSDAIFGPMLAQVDAVPPVTHALLVGDQVYADATANVFRTEQPAERWEALYRGAFDTPRMRDFLRQVPTLMVADDHEIEDDWAGVPPASVTDPALRAARADAQRLEQQARAAYEAFQWRHGAGAPAAAGPADGASSGCAPPLWYATCIAGFDYFVLDGRFERTITTSGEAGSMISDAQFDALEGWLEAAAPDRPCFLVSPSALWPVNDGLLGHHAYARRHDGWWRYPAQAARLVELLWRHPRRLVLLSGDAHCSLGALVTVRAVGGDRAATFETVVSSALYAPYPFANERAADYGVPGVGRRHRLAPGETALEFEWRVDYAVDAPGFTVVEAMQGPDGWALCASVRDETGIVRAAATWT